MSFAALAPYYRMMEFMTAGSELQRCRTAFLAEAANSKQALLLGEGPGRFLGELLRTNPRVQVTCVESSPRMITAARKKLGLSELARVRFIQADALTWQPPCARLT
jgi:spermidine synthase